MYSTGNWKFSFDSRSFVWRVMNEYTAFMALEIVDALVRSGAFDAVALDSVPGLYPSQRYDAETEPSNDALDRARLLSEAMRRLAANIDRTRTVVLFGNRQTEKTWDDATPGGRALRFYSSVRLGMRKQHRPLQCLRALGACLSRIRGNVYVRF